MMMASQNHCSSLALGISPCPNDTFAIYAWIHNLIFKSYNLQPIFADIETLNQLALKQEFAFCKVSAAMLPHLKNYRLLPCGAAMGIKSGPKVIAKRRFEISDLVAKKVVFPGQFTTAHALYSKLKLGCKEEQFLRYDQLMSHVRRKQADAAVIIHETRFNFEKQGFCEICDLGELWHKRWGLPLPLGVLVARNDVSENLEKDFIDHFRRSLVHGHENSTMSDSYSSMWSLDLSPNIRRQHIDHYVNDLTHTLSDEGYRAIDALNSMN